MRSIRLGIGKPLQPGFDLDVLRWFSLSYIGINARKLRELDHDEGSEFGHAVNMLNYGGSESEASVVDFREV